MKIEKVTKIIHYCMNNNDSGTAESFLQSYISREVKAFRERKTLNEEDQDYSNCKQGALSIQEDQYCSNCKHGTLSIQEEPCKSCYGNEPFNKNWEPKI